VFARVQTEPKKERAMKTLVQGMAIGVLMLGASAATVSAQTVFGNIGVPKAIGQPNQSCGSTTAPQTPGQAASAPGSAFNPNGKAGTVYAGQQPQNSKNPAAVSQYDVACFNQTK
jgi:hypothetical protein